MHIITLLICLLVPTLTTPLSFPPSPLSLRPTTNATHSLTTHHARRRLPAHDALLNITYYPSLPLPFPLWHQVLTAAHIQTITLHGDREVVEEPYVYHEGECYFRAESVPEGERRLTYGVLEEGIRMLVRFLAGVECVLSVVILEGGTDGGRPVGVMEIDNAGPRGVAGGSLGVGGKTS